MKHYTVFVETHHNHRYEVEAANPTAAAALFGPSVDIEDDGSILDEDGEEVICPSASSLWREVIAVRLEIDGSDLPFAPPSS